MPKLFLQLIHPKWKVKIKHNELQYYDPQSINAIQKSGQKGTLTLKINLSERKDPYILFHNTRKAKIYNTIKVKIFQ